MVVAACIFLFNLEARELSWMAQWQQYESADAEQMREWAIEQRWEETEGERERERHSPAACQLYGGVENKQITERCHKDSGLVISTFQ